MAGPRIKVTLINPEGAKIDISALRQDVTGMVRSVTFEGRRLMARYPAQRLRKSGYRRTGTLKRSWSTRVDASGNRVTGIVGSNSNIAPYNRFVQGPSGGNGQAQLPLFRGAGWQGVDELTKFVQDKVERGLEDIIDRLATR